VLEVIWLLPAVALFGFAVLLVLGRRIGEPLAGWFATAICGTAFVLAAIAFGQMLSRPAEERSVLSVLYTWLPVGGSTSTWPSRPISSRSPWPCSSPASVR